MGGPHHRNTSCIFPYRFCQGRLLPALQPSSPCFPALSSLSSWNLYQAEYWNGAMFEGTWGDAWNYRNRIELSMRTTHSCWCRVHPPFSATAREWMYSLLIRRCQCCPWPYLCSKAEQTKAHGSFMKFTFALLKCLSTSAQMLQYFWKYFWIPVGVWEVYNYYFWMVEQGGGVGNGGEKAGYYSTECTFYTTDFWAARA